MSAVTMEKREQRSARVRARARARARMRRLGMSALPKAASKAPTKVVAIKATAKSA